MNEEKKKWSVKKVDQMFRIIDPDGHYIAMASRGNAHGIVNKLNETAALTTEVTELKGNVEMLVDLLKEIRLNEKFESGEYFNPTANKITEVLTAINVKL